MNAEKKVIRNKNNYNGGYEKTLEELIAKYDRKFEDIPMEYLCPKDPNLSKKNKCPICNYQKQPQGPTLSKKLK